MSKKNNVAGFAGGVSALTTTLFLFSVTLGYALVHENISYFVWFLGSMLFFIMVGVSMIWIYGRING